MKVYCFYTTDGKITSVGQCADFDFANQVPTDGEYKMEVLGGLFSPNDFYVKDDSLVRIPAAPCPDCDFDYKTESWVFSYQKSLRKLRERRNSLLQATDWTQVPDAPVDHAAWATYRQELRDLPANTEDPRNVVWPDRP